MDTARAANVPVRMCGEMGGRPLEAMALIGIGAENFSITPAAVGPSQGDGPLARCRRSSPPAVPAARQATGNLRKALSDWARRHSVAIS
jgi:phosphotransferase system enzyme I (PtsP)